MIFWRCALKSVYSPALRACDTRTSGRRAQAPAAAFKPDFETVVMQAILK
jgi:hypothetical protein